MRYLLLIAAFLASTTWAAPSVVASQSTATSGTSHVLAVPAGAAGDLLVVVVAGDYAIMGGVVMGAAPAGWASRTRGTCARPFGIYYKVSDGSESSLTITSSVSLAAQAHVLRVSGWASATIEAFNSRAYNSSAGSNAPDVPNLIMPGEVDTLWVVGAFYNGAAPTQHPSGYGSPLDAQNTVNLSLSFKSLLAYSEDPGAFALAASPKVCAFGFGIY